MSSHEDGYRDEVVSGGALSYSFAKKRSTCIFTMPRITRERILCLTI